MIDREIWECIHLKVTFVFFFVLRISINIRGFRSTCRSCEQQNYLYFLLLSIVNIWHWWAMMNDCRSSRFWYSCCRRNLMNINTHENNPNSSFFLLNYGLNSSKSEFLDLNSFFRSTSQHPSGETKKNDFFQNVN